VSSLFIDTTCQYNTRKYLEPLREQWVPGSEEKKILGVLEEEADSSVTCLTHTAINNNLSFDHHRSRS